MKRYKGAIRLTNRPFFFQPEPGHHQQQGQQNYGMPPNMGGMMGAQGMMSNVMRSQAMGGYDSDAEGGGGGGAGNMDAFSDKAVR